jgi:hypothetical protein
VADFQTLSESGKHTAQNITVLKKTGRLVPSTGVETALRTVNRALSLPSNGEYGSRI